MEYVKTIKDERGKVNITVKLVTFLYGPDAEGNRFRYDVSVSCTPPGKRIERYGYNDIVTADEIKSAKMELWNLIKP